MRVQAARVIETDVETRRVPSSACREGSARRGSELRPRAARTVVSAAVATHAQVTACRSRPPKRRPLACRHHRHILQLCEFDREQDARAARRRIVTEDVRLHDRVECGDAQFPSRQRQ